MNKLKELHEKKEILLGKSLSNRNKPISVGLIGAGSMGKGLFRQIAITPGLNTLILVDIEIQRAIQCAEEIGRPFQIVDSLSSLHQAIQNHKLALCDDGMLVAEYEEIDVLVEASSAITAAGKVCEKALCHGKHVVMMNSEADLIFGPYLMSLAHNQGVVYTSCDGDQHGVLARQIQEITLWGFDLVLAGNIKGFLDRYSNPTKIIPEADKRNLDYRMATAYTDGTKLSIEMSLLANALDYSVSSVGMEGPKAKNVNEALHLFDFDRIRTSGSPIVDYILGAEPGGGVFVIGTTNDPYQQSMMEYYKMGKGPYYLFYRPYHLCHIESMLTILEAVHSKQSLLEPRFGFRTNVYTYAKKDLTAGEILDGIGGYTCYGMIENNTPSQKSQGLPICLSESVKITRDIKQDEKIYWDDILINPNREDFQLYSKSLGIS